jgi:tRNA1Val (adenine37-N6)-methyltransferase
MANGFAFKQFTVHDDRCQMKVGTDGVLLGAWADVSGARFILDIGTGSGMIALMLAQRNAMAIIDGVEILESDAGQAVENVARSPWPDRITIYHSPIQMFESGRKYDLVVSNPPYFTRSYLPPVDTRASVRHTVSLNHVELISRCTQLLEPQGAFCVILPPESLESFVEEAASSGLNVHRQLSFQTRPGRPVERYLIEFRPGPRTAQHESMCLYSGPFEGQGKDSWSSGYRKLVGDYYL